MAHYTLKLDFIAAVPINHRIKLDVYEQDWGSFSEDWKQEPEKSALTDLDTGIVWNAGDNYKDFKDFEPAKKRRLHRTYWGTVTFCEVITTRNDTLLTRLTVFPTEGPSEGAPYRTR